MRVAHRGAVGECYQRSASVSVSPDPQLAGVVLGGHPRERLDQIAKAVSLEQTPVEGKRGAWGARAISAEVPGVGAVHHHGYASEPEAAPAHLGRVGLMYGEQLVGSHHREKLECPQHRSQPSRPSADPEGVEIGHQVVDVQQHPGPAKALAEDGEDEEVGGVCDDHAIVVMAAAVKQGRDEETAVLPEEATKAVVAAPRDRGVVDADAADQLDSGCSVRRQGEHVDTPAGRARRLSLAPHPDLVHRVLLVHDEED